MSAEADLFSGPPRVRTLNGRGHDIDGDYVLYWMVGARRTRHNFALERALSWASEAGRPLIVLEALRVDYRWASARHHAFVIQGMADNRAAFADTPVRYWPYVEPEPGAGKGLVDALAARAVVVVTDDWPGFFVGPMIESVGARLPVRTEAVDGNGLLPIDHATKGFARAYDLRRFLQRELRPWLVRVPSAEPLADIVLPSDPELPAEVEERWPRASRELLAHPCSGVRDLPVDQDVPPVTDTPGGSVHGREVLQRFVGERMRHYAEGRRDVTDVTASELSPWLHYGHLGAHEVFAAITESEGWTPDRLSTSKSGAREGWWGMSPGAEGYLDQLVTWRELGFNLYRHNPRPDDYETLPDWAQATLEEHASDEREWTYELDQFERAETHDEVWNAAQRQLLRSGVIHNYLRMYWGKMVLAWSASPQEALAIVFELNNRWALDGRDPNSSTGITWVFGRYDRPWGPEREVFGKVRYMSPENTRKKLRLAAYLERWDAQGGLFSGSRE
ncbi:MAG: deoxyribodipyrimidine photo-lyase [Planctomycetota bacterium]|nr:MAG: deoxyribodipyrimidine photo-lyase [Planctomycetota bacterium]